MLKRIVLTRPRADSDTLAEELSKRGYETLSEPLTSVHYYPETHARLLPFLAANATLLATSQHAARAPHGTPSYVPWIVSGQATVRALASLGCLNIKLTGQTAETLRYHLTSRAHDVHPYVYLTGRHRTLDLETILRPRGYDIHTVEAYEARELDEFSSALIRALEEKAVSAVLFFSSRHAEIFEELVKKEHLEKTLSEVQAFCLSMQIAKRLQLPWEKIHASAQPETESLLTLLKKL